MFCFNEIAVDFILINISNNITQISFVVFLLDKLTTLALQIIVRHFCKVAMYCN